MVPTYIVVLKEGASYVSGGEVYSDQQRLGAVVIQEMADIPDLVAQASGFMPDDTILYLESASKEYVNPSDVETIINIDTLIDEELDNLDQAIESPL